MNRRDAASTVRTVGQPYSCSLITPWSRKLCAVSSTNPVGSECLYLKEEREGRGIRRGDVREEGEGEGGLQSKLP